MGKKKDNEGEVSTLLDFIIPQKVDAFVEAYMPTDIESELTEYFTDAKLREFFKAWICPAGDPLKEYLNILCQHGFRMKVTMAGDVAVLAIRK